MQFYTKTHQHYCGIDLHAKTMYVCILNPSGDILVHRNIKSDPATFLKLIAPYQDDLVVCVECIFTWYWIADVCAREHIPFVLGHALYMKAIHGGKALLAHIHNTLSQYNLPAQTKNLRYAVNREPLRRAFPDPSVQRSIDLDLSRIDFYDDQLSKLEWYLKQAAKAVDKNTIIRLKSINGVGDILSLVILYEIHDFNTPAHTFHQLNGSKPETA